MILDTNVRPSLRTHISLISSYTYAPITILVSYEHTTFPINISMLAHCRLSINTDCLQNKPLRRKKLDKRNIIGRDLTRSAWEFNGPRVHTMPPTLTRSDHISPLYTTEIPEIYRTKHFSRNSLDRKEKKRKEKNPAFILDSESRPRCFAPCHSFFGLTQPAASS